MDIKQLSAPLPHLRPPARSREGPAPEGAVRAALHPPLRVRRLAARALRRAGRAAHGAQHPATRTASTSSTMRSARRYLIGAGGTRCPVYRTLFREANPRAAELQTVTLEHEIEYDWKDPRLPSLVLRQGPARLLVVRAEGERLAQRRPRRHGRAAQAQRQGHQAITGRSSPGMLDRKLAARRAVRSARVQLFPARQSRSGRASSNAFITGDAAGLATRDMCEGIGPADPQRRSGRECDSRRHRLSAARTSPARASAAGSPAACSTGRLLAARVSYAAA